MRICLKSERREWQLSYNSQGKRQQGLRRDTQEKGGQESGLRPGAWTRRNIDHGWRQEEEEGSRAG